MASCGGSISFTQATLNELGSWYNEDWFFERGIKEEMKSEEGKEELGNKW